MAKRKAVGEDLALSLYNKKTKNEIALISSREKAVIQAVNIPFRNSRLVNVKK